MSHVVHMWRKNDRERVLATLDTYRGYEIADIRVHVLSDGGLVPTRKGISVRVEDLPRLREAVDALIEAQEFAAA